MSLPTMTLVGNLTKDPELKFTQSGSALLKLSVACNDRKKDDNGNWSDGDTTYLDVSAWRTLAENAAESLLKGDTVIVVGRFKSRSYEATDGSKRTVYEVDAQHIGPDLNRATAKVNKVGRVATNVEKSTFTANDPWTADSDSGLPF